MSMIQSIINLIPTIKKAIPFDISIAVSDLNKIVEYFPGNEINLGIKKGQQLKDEEPLLVAIKHNKRINMEIPEHFFGFECIGSALPIVENNTIVGALGVAVRNHNEKALKQISTQVELSLTQATETLEKTSSSSEELAQLSNELKEQSRLTNTKVEGMTNLLQFIEKIASQTKILGLNASIIAAKANSEDGRAFSVVAKEIQNLASETTNSLTTIKDYIVGIQDGMHKIAESSSKVTTISERQAASNQELLSFIEEIQAMAINLHEYANKL